MTDAEVKRAYETDGMFGSDFETAIDARERELPTCSSARLAELLELFEAIDCYYGPQSSSLGLAAKEAARRLRDG